MAIAIGIFANLSSLVWMFAVLYTRVNYIEDSLNKHKDIYREDVDKIFDRLEDKVNK